MKFAAWRRIAAIAMILALILTTFATLMASAADTTAASRSESRPGRPPSGQSDAQPGTPPSGGGGADTMTYDYSGTLSGALTADGKEKTSDGKTAAATEADQNAALAENGGTLTITNGKLTKSGGGTNGDNCNFYGINSILLALNDGSAAYVSGSSLNADSEGSNGIFATDNGTVFANNDTIATAAGNSRGLDATYGGTILANKMDISTQGDHSASIATDRGGGSVSVTNSTLSTAGSGSPLLYSTGDIEVDNVTGTAAGSQIAGMEGRNTILISNSKLESTITKATASDPMADGVIIYQSTSGDAESATGEAARFEASDSTLKSAIESGAMFYFTNTKANVVLSNTTLDFDSEKANLISVRGNDANSWGTPGSNGANVTFTGLGETLSGSIDADTISSLNLFLLRNTVYTGATGISTNAVNTSATEAPITVSLDGTSKWVVTGDSAVTNLNAADGASIVDANGRTVTIAAGGKTVVTGESSVTVTVTGTYSNTVTTGENNALSAANTDRTAFDKYYGVTTSFGTNGAAAAATTVSGTNAAAASSGTAAAQTTVDAAETEAEKTSGHTAAYVIALTVIVLGGAGAFAYSRRKKRK